MIAMRKEDTRRRNISFGLHAENFGRGGYQVGKEKKKIFRSLAAERLAAAMFFFCPYDLLGSSHLSSSKIPLKPFNLYVN